jgi:putative ABC transport system permease protein
MFRNYLAAALRNLVRNRLYAAINVIGLAVGLTAALLIMLFVRDEFSYDKWLPAYERTYKVSSTMAMPNLTIHNDRAPYIAAALLKQDYGQIEAIVRFAPFPASLRHNDAEFQETLTWADPNLFDVLQLPAEAGDLAAALQQPDGIVLTRALARKYFGRDNPIGETIEINRKVVMHVTAVLEDLPSNTHLALTAIASGRNAASPLMQLDSRAMAPTTGIIPAVFTYLRLAPGVSAEQLRQVLPDFFKRHPRFTTADAVYTLQLSPIAAVHLQPANITGVMKPSGNIATVYSALLIAVLIVAVAAINFVNLTTARAVRRAVEVGVRKVSGAVRRQLIAQFICESVFYALLGMIVAIAGAQLLLPTFNGFLQRTIVFDYGRDPALMGTMIAIVMTVGALGGTYPAFVLSRFSPAAVLKGAVPGLLKGGSGRQFLVGLQFAVLIVLALVSTLIYRQAHYAMNDALRFDKDQVLLVNINGGPLAPTVSCDTAFATQVRALPGVREAACSSASILNQGTGDSPSTDVVGPSGVTVNSKELIVDFGFFELHGLKPLAGRFFSRDFGADAMTGGNIAAAVVINESLSRAMGFEDPQSAIGETVRWRPLLPIGRLFGASGAAAPTQGASQIIGVVPDFEQGSVREGLSPGIYWINPVGYSLFNIKLAGDEVPETLAAIDRIWKQVGPSQPINRRFLDQQVQAMYRDVTQLTQTTGAFVAVAVFIACLGLFGLAAFAAESRTKEIGVRKALGASTGDILGLLLWEFSRPVLWASAISWPVAYVIMRRWLGGFADRVDIGVWTFPVATILALVIAVLTVAGHALLVARAQPVKALRYE